MANRIVFSTELDNKDLMKDLANTEKEIKKTEKTISAQEAKKSPLEDQAEALRAKIKAAREEVQRYRQEWAAGITGADKNQSAAQGRLAGAQAEYQKVVEKIGKIDEKLQPAYQKLDGLKEKAGGLHQKISKSSSSIGRMKDATAAAEKKMNAFGKRIKDLAKRAFIFTLISAALRSLKDSLWSAIKTNDDAVAAVAKLKGALRTLAQPIIEVVIPAFTTLVNVLASVIAAMAHVFAVFFGTTAEDAAKSAEELYNEQQAIEGVGNAAKEAAKQLAPFDEINQLAGETAGSAADSIAPDFSDFREADLPEWLTSLTLTMRDILFKWEDLTAEDVIQKVVSALTALAGTVIGFAVGGVGGAVLGMTIGAGVGAYISDLLFDNDGVVNRTEMLKLFCLALGALVGGVIGFVVGGPVGAAIGITIGAIVTVKLTDVIFKGFNTIKETVPGFTGIGPDYSWMFKSNAKAPGLATGSVVPPNREFLAVLGDNKTEPEVVSPLSTMKRAFKEAMQESGGGGGTFTCIVNLDGKEVARNTVKHVNDMTRSAGKPVLLV